MRNIAAKLLKSFGRAVKLLKKEGKGGKKKGIYKFKVYFYMVTFFFFFFFLFFWTSLQIVHIR